MDALHGWLLAALACLVSGPSSGQVLYRPEFQVNTYTTSGQYDADVAGSEASSTFVVVWQSYRSDGGDTSSSSIHARRFSSVGVPFGGQLQVNTYTTDSQSEPAVAMDSAGKFVVVWTSYGSAGSDSHYSSIQGQRFNSAGVPLGNQFQVNTYTTGSQWAPDVAADATGGFVVVWQSAGSAGSDSSISSIQGRRFSSTGTPIGSDFQVNAYTTGAQYDASVAMLVGSAFVVAWDSAGSFQNDTDSYSVQARRFDSNGNPIGPEFQVNQYTTSAQSRPSVSGRGLGEFVVAWTSSGSSGSDYDATSVQARAFNAAGSPVGPEFQVNSFTTDYQSRTSVSLSSDGRFLVTWASYGSFGSDHSGQSIQAQHFDPGAQPLGGEIQINTYTTSHQTVPAVASVGAREVAVTWQSAGSAGTDTSETSIQARIIDTASFYDGFESGDTGRWSVTVP